MKGVHVTDKTVATELTKANPDTLIRNYLRTSIICFLVIITLACYGTYRVYLNHVVAEAERSSVALAGSLMEVERQRLVTRSPSGSEELQILPAALPGLNRTFGLFFRNFNILKIKIFDRQARVIFSNDRSIVGKDDPHNLRLKNALAGRTDSKVVKKEKILDFGGAEKFAVDVVETYIPVRDSNGTVIGSFELYQDVTLYNRAIIRLVIMSGIMLTLILSWVFLVSFLLLRKEARQLKDVQEILRNQAATDFLTGIYNRRQLLARCEEEMSRLRRLPKDSPPEGKIGFIMVDIDHFKKINDTYGHDAGDEVIRELALRLKGVIRQHDVIGRYGGEEFLVVLPNATEEQVRTIAERLWTAARSTPVMYGKTAINVTISLGVAAAMSGEETHEKVIIRADDALYRSKHGGRDRITHD